jgi:3-oxoacyl-[acyl-carrier protein] reductase
LVNNAGLDDFVPLQQVTEHHFHNHYNVNVLGVILAVKEAVEYIDKKQAAS